MKDISIKSRLVRSKSGTIGNTVIYGQTSKLVKDNSGNLITSGMARGKVCPRDDLENQVPFSEKKDMINRIATIAGHMSAIKHMLEDNRNIEDILNQLSAVESSTKQLKKLIIKSHLSKSVSYAASYGDMEGVKKINDLINRMA